MLCTEALILSRRQPVLSLVLASYLVSVLLLKITISSALGPRQQGLSTIETEQRTRLDIAAPALNLSLVVKQIS